MRVSCSLHVYAMWYAGSKEIIELVNYSTRKFDIELPLGREILHLSHFCWELAAFFNKKGDSVRLELQDRKEPKMAILKWFHFYGCGSRTETLEVPEDAIWEIHGKCLEYLDEKCERLAEMCGWYKDHPKDAVER